MSKEEAKIPAFIQEFTDIKSEDPEEFKNSFKEKYVPVEQLPTLILKSEFEDVRKSIYGKRFGEATSKTLKIAKDAGFEISGEEIKGKEIEDVVKVITTKAKEKITELEASTKDNPTLEEFKEKENTYKQRLKEQTEALKTANEKIESLSLEKEDAVKATDKKHLIKDLKRGAVFSPDAGELPIIGFWTKFESQYNFDVENEEPIVTNKKGERIRDPKVASKYLNAEELIKIEIEKAGLAKLNPDGGKGTLKKETTTVTTPTDKKDTGRKVNRAFYQTI